VSELGEPLGGTEEDMLADSPHILSPAEDSEARRKRALGEATARIAHKSEAFKRVFRDHPDGKYVLLCLKQEFMPSQIFNKDPLQCAANAMARDFIDYIERMTRFQQEAPHVADTEILPERS
jgi:hypothetical protein